MHLNHHIFVDGNGKATVQTQTSTGPLTPTTQLQQGDTVTFTSNREDSVIRYKKHTGTPPPNTQKGSPFAELAEGDLYEVRKGVVFRVKNACDDNNHFIFECGRVDQAGQFSVWGARDGRLRGGNTPGPEA